MAQDARPYLTKATFYYAFDGWADIWVNGIPIIESQRTTTEEKGYQVTSDIPEHLCYFREQNVLAIENANAYNSPLPFRNQIGMAYVLRLRFSDGRELILSSNDIQDHKSYYLPDKEMGEPRAWQQASFNDGGWTAPYVIGTRVPGIAELSVSKIIQETQFLSAAGPTCKSEYAGEKHLYRRYFNLNISPNPLCVQSKVPEVEKPVTRPRNTPTPPPAQIPTTFTPTEADPALPRPVFKWVPTPIPTAIWVPRAVPTWTLVFVPQPTPTFPIFPTKAIELVLPPPTLPTPARPYAKRQRNKPTPTPIPEFGVSNRADPVEKMAPTVTVRIGTPIPTPGVTPEPAVDQAQTIVFENQPANIYLSYADGPGVYRLEVVDSSGNHLRNLCEKHVVAQQDEWVDWDGKDDSGREMPQGQYTVLYTKDGKSLNKLILVKTGSP